MSFTSLLPQACTIHTLTDGTVDAHRNFVRNVSTVDSPCRLVYKISTEPDAGAGLLGSWLLFLPAGTAITAASQVLIGLRLFRVDGTPNRVQGARSEHHVEAHLLEVSDVEGG